LTTEGLTPPYSSEVAAGEEEGDYIGGIGEALGGIGGSDRKAL